MVMESTTTAMPSLMFVVATGASVGLLIDMTWPARRAPMAALAGFGLCWVEASRSRSSRCRLSSSIAAAPVIACDVKIGDAVFIKRGDLGIGDVGGRLAGARPDENLGDTGDKSGPGRLEGID